MKGYSCNCTRTLLGNPLLPLEYQSYHRQVLRRSSNVAVVDIGSQWDFPDLAVRCFGDLGLSKGAKDCVYNFSTKTSYLTSHLPGLLPGSDKGFSLTARWGLWWLLYLRWKKKQKREMLDAGLETES